MTPEPPTERPLRILFLLLRINFDRVFEGLLRELLRRGHEVHVALEVAKAGLPASAADLFDRLQDEHPAFTYELLAPRADGWRRFATSIRLAIDYLRYLEPEFAAAGALRERARERAPRSVTLPLRLRGLRGPRQRAVVGRMLRRIEAALPTPPPVRDLLAGHRPDVILVSPLVGLGSGQGDYIRAAHELGIPAVLAVASWDNLTNKGVIRDVPDRTIVWNPAQVEEAVALHGLPRASVVASGAHTFDHWFAWGPSTTHAEFARQVGLDPQQRFLLYVCSSGFVAGDEVEFVREWLQRLRASPDSRLREIGVLIRPHPQNGAIWREDPLADGGRTVVWPLAGAAPTDASHKAGYYDSLYHSSAVVGINTSALIESAIVGRPVFTIVTDRFRSTQEGTLHFAHLTGRDGTGLLNVAHSWEQHLADLAGALEDPQRHAGRIAAFLAAFVRPNGLDEPAAPHAAAAIEAAAAEARAPVARKGAATRAMEVLTPIAAGVSALSAGGRERAAGALAPLRRAARRTRTLLGP